MNSKARALTPALPHFHPAIQGISCLLVFLTWGARYFEYAGGGSAVVGQLPSHVQLSATISQSLTKFVSVELVRWLSWERVCLQCRRPRFDL